MSDDRFIDTPPAGLEGWRDVWREKRRYPPKGGILGRMIRGAFLFAQRVAGEGDRQSDFNLVVLDLIDDLKKDVADLRRDVHTQTHDLVRDLRKLNEDMGRELGTTNDKVEAVVRRGDALVSAIDRKAETIASRLRDLTNPAADVTLVPSRREDFVYRRFEDALRGSEAEVRDASRYYLEYARTMNPVIDVGCGRGEFLSLCKDEGVAAHGFDTNERAVADLVTKGLSASHGGVPDCLTETEAGSVGMIVAMHVVEHLPFEELFGLFEQAARTLKPGGFFAIETPNAESIISSAVEFWKDPTHLGPRHEAALVSLGREFEFGVEASSTSAGYERGTCVPVTDDASDDVRALAATIEGILYADLNLRLVLRKKG